MTARLVLRGLREGKVRFACAVLGIASAVGAVVFVRSLKTTNEAQAPALARRAVAPWQAWRTDGISFGRGRRGGVPDEIQAPDAELEAPAPDRTVSVLPLTIDYRPGGHVLQGPPMRALLAPAEGGVPYANASLEGRMPDESSAEPEIVVAESVLVRFGRGEPPPLGTEVKFLGRRGTMTARIVGYLSGVRVQPGWPDTFANAAAWQALADEERGTLSLWRGKVAGRGVRTADDIAASFQTDAGRNFGRSQSLLLWAAALTALCLLVNSLFLSLEANRRTLALLRLAGLSRGGVVRCVLLESLLATAAGTALGLVASLAALRAFVGSDPEMFPVGMAVSAPAVAGTCAAAVVISLVAALLILRPALSVGALEAVDELPHTSHRRFGMTIAFAFGFGAFVAVEVWGASLMKPFVPSPEWPDAIVSLLPAGVDRAELDGLRDLGGVARLAELRPFQADFWPEDPMPSPRGSTPEAPGGGRRMARNVLFLGSDWLPGFRFVEGSSGEARQALSSTNACVITAMMAEGRNLHRGDVLRVSVRGDVREVAVVGVVDLNWHMVTSRGLVRGLNGASPMTEGPAFVSPATLESLRGAHRGGPGGSGGPGRRRPVPGPADGSRVTHLWLDYRPEFLAENGVFPAGRIVEEEIRRALGDPETAAVRLHARDEIADGTLAHGSDIIGSMAKIPFLFIAVLAFGLVALMVASADASRREFATLRTIGATHGQLARRLAGEALRTAAAGLVLGLLGGVAAGVLTARATRAAMTMWTIPACFVVPWRAIAIGAATAVAMVVVVSVPASLLLVRRALRAGLAR